MQSTNIAARDEVSSRSWCSSRSNAPDFTFRDEVEPLTDEMIHVHNGEKRVKPMKRMMLHGDAAW